MISGRRLELPTARSTEFLDITDRLQDEVSASGLLDGRLHVQSLHTTLGLAVNRHDDLARRLDPSLPEPDGGGSHGGFLLLQPSCTLLVEGGRLVLGRRQSVFAVELGGPRHRLLALQLEGRFAPLSPEADRQLVELELSRQLLVDPEPVRLPMLRLVEAGGKRLRPMLVMLASRLGPARDPLRAAQLAAAIELIHDATLVHDDYVDEAPIRRGRATVAAAEGPARAVAVGDYYFAKATRIIAELDDPVVTSTIAAAMETICLSQIDDVRLRGLYPGDYGSYLRVVRGKTAALFAAACRAGAQLSAGEPAVADRLERFGDLLGIAFQMADDLLDYSESSGKPRGQDIRERVVSLPLIYASEDPHAGDRVRDLLKGLPAEAEVREVQRLVAASGALERVAEEARGLVRKAVGELDGVELDGVRPALAELARSAVDRAR